jgi:hypothetical protein
MTNKFSLLTFIVLLIGMTSSQNPSELIINGNFSQNTCPKSKPICFFKTNNSVTGWSPDPEIELVYGSVYSEFLGNERVIELAAKSNGCIFQIIKNMTPGNYDLKINFIARKGTVLEDSQFSIFFNNYFV